MTDTSTQNKTSYILEMHSPCGAVDRSERFSKRPSSDECDSLTEEWVGEGDWGDEGASLDYQWTLCEVNEDGDLVEIDEGSGTLELEPNHDALIRRAGGDPDCDHDWEGVGGLDSNPGVWSTGGTSMVFVSQCQVCGLIRRERTTGSQRNPGEHDTVSYEQPEDWVGDDGDDDE